jgi:predicted SAM-dependent methyltransferase
MKLDICTQSKHHQGFITVDGKAGPNVNIVTDIREKLPFEDESTEEIISCATLEHLLLSQASRLLKEFNRILIPNGKLTVAVPDLNRIAKAYLDKSFDYRMINQYLYGQIFENSFMEFDCHKSAFDFQMLKQMLSTSGFKDIQEAEYNEPMHIKELMIKVICNKL